MIVSDKQSPEKEKLVEIIHIVFCIKNTASKKLILIR